MGIKNKATGLFAEFKAFAFKGNIVDMAIGVIIGGAFGKIVTSFVNDIVMPCVTAIIASASGTKDAAEGLKTLSYTTASGVEIPYGNFIGGVVDFIIVAIVVFIVMKKFLGFMQNMRKEAEKPAEPPAPPAPSKEEVLLTEIRDLLKNK
ncbi:MAG: large-conductance mechanosensitive channel protein MscL [Fibrobacter sp.]|nr:large-conductance mechanosensitive channel protein MscL [Fibrobacter sp.]